MRTVEHTSTHTFMALIAAVLLSYFDLITTILVGLEFFRDGYQFAGFATFGMLVSYVTCYRHPLPA